MEIAFLIVLAVVTGLYIGTVRRWNYFIHGSGIFAATIGVLLVALWIVLIVTTWEYVP